MAAVVGTCGVASAVEGKWLCIRGVCFECLQGGNRGGVRFIREMFVGLCVPEGDTIIAGCVEVCEDSFDSLVVALGRSLGVLR